MRELRNWYKILYRKPEGHKEFGRPRSTLEDITKKCYANCNNVCLIDIGQSRTSFGAFVNMVMNLQHILKKEGKPSWPAGMTVGFPKLLCSFILLLGLQFMLHVHEGASRPISPINSWQWNWQMQNSAKMWIYMYWCHFILTQPIAKSLFRGIFIFNSRL
jgi:hypothetical protein